MNYLKRLFFNSKELLFIFSENYLETKNLRFINSLIISG